MYGMNEAMAASDERTAAKNTRPFLSEANSMHRAKPVFGFAYFDFAFDIALTLLKIESGEVGNP